MEHSDPWRDRKHRPTPGGGIPTGALRPLDSMTPSVTGSGPDWNCGKRSGEIAAGQLPADIDPSDRPAGSLRFQSTTNVLLASVFIAGFRFHHGMHPKVLGSMEPGDMLVLGREPGNPYDEFAVAIYTAGGARLGYLPRGMNEPIALMIDQDVELHAVITMVDPEAEPWKRVRIVVWAAFPVAVVVDPGVN